MMIFTINYKYYYTKILSVEFTGSIDIIFITLKDAPSSSSSFIVHTDRLDDKDETDESI